MGSRFAKLSGSRFMLVGDAGSLIDPLQGHGIDKAMISGKLAAIQAIQCFEKDDFNADFLKNYKQQIIPVFTMAFNTLPTNIKTINFNHKSSTNI